MGFQAIIVCVNDRYLTASFCGRLFDRDFIRDLPPGVDPCGENGEYYSFVFDAPYFSQPIAVVRGEVVRRTYQLPSGNNAGDDAPFAAGFWFCDLLPGWRVALFVLLNAVKHLARLVEWCGRDASLRSAGQPG